MTIEPFLLRAILAGLGVALVAGPLGCFVVWRRMAYFGAALSHAALLGIALSFLLQADLRLGVIFVSISFSTLLFLLERLQRLSSDTLLGILAHATLAAGLVVISLSGNAGVDLMGYLFGDILSVSREDLLWIWLGGGLVLALLVRYWRELLLEAISEDLAVVEGVNSRKIRFLFLLLLSLVIAVAIQVVGILLIVSLLIIPAAAARRVSRSPEQMALLAGIAGILAVLAGLWGSWQWDTPAGPSIVLAASLLFLLSLLAPARE
ncbi:MAG: iron chelate uptake ABC transporter family permease subunit [Pseudomonadota bacterium]|nr:iron chelate uptake ABC transporter family permease subunit [Pseudomonadota bacterium]